MLQIDNQTQNVIDATKLEEIASQLGSNREVELVFVDLQTMQEINREYRNQDKPTDVLSFPLDSMGLVNIPLGSIVICIPIAEEMAENYGHSLEEEVALLFIHGMLHLQGYDHESDNGEHREAEEHWIKHFSLPNSLIVRVLG